MRKVTAVLLISLIMNLALGVALSNSVRLNDEGLMDMYSGSQARLRTGAIQLRSLEAPPDANSSREQIVFYERSVGLIENAASILSYCRRRTSAPVEPYFVHTQETWQDLAALTMVSQVPGEQMSDAAKRVAFEELKVILGKYLRIADATTRTEKGVDLSKLDAALRNEGIIR